MATAHLAGFPPVTGFIAFAAASIGFATIGANYFVVACADSTIAPIFAGGLATLAAAGSPDYHALCASFALLSGTILLCCGLFRLGWIADLVSKPVTIGFLAGIACHIVISQLPSLGIPPPQGSLLRQASTIAGSLDQSRFALAGATVFAVTVCAEWINPRIPGSLLGIMAATIAVYWFGLERDGVEVLGQIPGEFPHFQIPLVRLMTSFKPRRSPSSSSPPSWCKPPQRRAHSRGVPNGRLINSILPELAQQTCWRATSAPFP